MNEIARCPNPECGLECRLKHINHGPWQIACDRASCGYRGPVRETKAEAIRLHNAICAAPDDGKRAAGWIPVGERLPEPLTPVLVNCTFLLDGEDCIHLLYMKPSEMKWRFDDTQDDLLSDGWTPTHWRYLPIGPTNP